MKSLIRACFATASRIPGARAGARPVLLDWPGVVPVPIILPMPTLVLVPVGGQKRRSGVPAPDRAG